MGQGRGREVSSPWPLGYLGPLGCSALAGEPPCPPPHYLVHILLGAARGSSGNPPKEVESPGRNRAQLLPSHCVTRPASPQRRRIGWAKGLFKLNSMLLNVPLLLGLCPLPLGSPNYLPQAEPSGSAGPVASGSAGWQLPVAPKGPGKRVRRDTGCRPSHSGAQHSNPSPGSPATPGGPCRPAPCPEFPAAAVHQ